MLNGPPQGGRVVKFYFLSPILYGEEDQGEGVFKPSTLTPGSIRFAARSRKRQRERNRDRLNCLCLGLYGQTAREDIRIDIAA